MIWKPLQNLSGVDTVAIDFAVASRPLRRVTARTGETQMGNYTVLWGDDTVIQNNTPNRTFYDDEGEAFRFAKQRLMAGARVTEISFPSGEIWKEARIRDFFAKTKHSD